MNLTNLKRWIKASIKKTIKQKTQGIDLFVEGEDRNTNTKDKHFELRIDGPYSYPCGTKGEYKHYIEVNILINSTRAEDDIYERENLQGIAAEMLNQDMCITKTGNAGKNEADDGDLVGVMSLIPHDQIKVSDFGKINSDAEVYQSVAEAHYEMYTSE